MCLCLRRRSSSSVTCPLCKVLETSLGYFHLAALQILLALVGEAGVKAEEEVPFKDLHVLI